MRKDTTNPDMLFDIRVVQRNIKNRTVTKAEYQERLDKLQDVSANAELIRTRLGEEDDEPVTEEDDTDEG